MTVYDRINTLTEETTKTALDSAFFAQRQNAQLFQAFLDTVEANQKTVRDLTLRGIQQAQEAQVIWAELVRTGFENFTNLSQSQLHEVSEQVGKVNHQVKSNTTKAEAAAAK